jgi:FKBP-type peptidyl-prolyl cis-trans isomerase
MDKKVNNYLAAAIIIIFSVIMAYIIWEQYISATQKTVYPNLIENNNMENNKEKLIIKTTKEGTGDAAVSGDVVSVHYTGKFINGTKFDSSVDRGTPFSFTLGAGQVIKGWDQGVLGMKVGEKRTLTIPPDLAYGAAGIPGAIPANSILIFDVELLGITKK